MPRIGTVWNELLHATDSVFTKPAFERFLEISVGWILCSTRRTITGIIRGLGSTPRKHDAYHRFFRCGAWCVERLFSVLAHWLVKFLVPNGDILIDLDDTLFHKSGPRVEKAARFRDAVRSKGKSITLAHGLNVLVLTLRICPPWRGEPLALPVAIRIHEKKGTPLPDLAEEMARSFVGQFPDRNFVLCGDGAYACLASRDIPRTHIISRMRRDAAIYELPKKPRKGKRGRKATKGKRLPCPLKMGPKVKKWIKRKVLQRTQRKSKLLFSRVVIWDRSCGKRPLRLVIVRDPKGNEPDDYFFTTNIKATPEYVASIYAGRWSIEMTFRDVKQHLGGEEPQSWKHQGPERTVALSCWLYSAVWASYVVAEGAHPRFEVMPWHRSKRMPSFKDALASLRRALWHERIFAQCRRGPLSAKMIKPLLNAVALAA